MRLGGRPCREGIGRDCLTCVGSRKHCRWETDLVEVRYYNGTVLLVVEMSIRIAEVNQSYSQSTLLYCASNFEALTFARLSRV